MAIAHALGGEAKELRTGDKPALLVALPPTGRAPVLVRDHGHVISVVVTRTLNITDPPKAMIKRIPEIVAATQKWMKDRDPQMLSFFGVALALLPILEEEFPGTWIADVSGGAEPTELELQRGKAVVGVSPSKVVVWAGDKAYDFLMLKRENVDDKRAELVIAVHAQLASYEKHVEANKRLHTVVKPLADRLAAALKLKANVSIYGSVTASSCEKATIAFGTHQVAIEYRDGDFRVHAGLTGSLGYDATLDAMDEARIVGAIETARTKLTINDLKRGARYRVIASVGPLVKGTVVTFVGLNDIDNHYGELDFELDGKPIAIGGDYSSPDHTMLGETHRYLAPIE